MLKGKITLEAGGRNQPSLYHAKRIPLSKAQAKDFVNPTVANLWPRFLDSCKDAWCEAPRAGASLSEAVTCA
jgi:hypothetical protein